MRPLFPAGLEVEADVGGRSPTRGARDACEIKRGSSSWPDLGIEGLAEAEGRRSRSVLEGRRSSELVEGMVSWPRKTYQAAGRGCEAKRRRSLIRTRLLPQLTAMDFQMRDFEEEWRSCLRRGGAGGCG